MLLRWPIARAVRSALQCDDNRRRKVICGWSQTLTKRHSNTLKVTVRVGFFPQRTRASYEFCRQNLGMESWRLACCYRSGSGHCSIAKIQHILPVFMHFYHAQLGSKVGGHYASLNVGANVSSTSSPLPVSPATASVCLPRGQNRTRKCDKLLTSDAGRLLFQLTHIRIT